MLMKLWQTAIFTAIVFADIYWEWGSKGYAIYVVAGFASYAMTIWPLKLYDFIKTRLSIRRLNKASIGPVEVPFGVHEYRARGPRF
jgi:hypothetical protein